MIVRQFENACFKQILAFLAHFQNNLRGDSNRVGRDWEIRPTKIHYQTKTEKKWMLIFSTRQDRDKTVWFLYVRDETETRLNLKFQARPSKIEANKTRPRRDSPKILHLRRDRDKTSSKIFLRPKRDRDSRPSLDSNLQAKKVRIEN